VKYLKKSRSGAVREQAMSGVEETQQKDSSAA